MQIMIPYLPRMAKSDEDEDDDDHEVNFLDVQRNLKSYSQKKLVSLANVLIDAYHNPISNKNALTDEIGEVEHERDDLLVVVVDSKETIEELKKDKDALTEKIGEIEDERDDLLVVVVDVKKSIEELKKDNVPLKTSVENCMNSSKGKEVASEAYLNLENELKKATVKGSSQRWIHSGTWNEKTLTNSIENVYYVNGLTYTLLSVSQICDKGNKVEFLSKSCTVTNLVTSEVVLVAKRFKNIYVIDFESLNTGDLTCLSVVDDDAELWHRRLGHASFTLLNKLIKKDLVRGLSKSKLKDYKVCDACV
ncbi:uncharacterized protein [Nicotiana tomentosiformis]|uniref:uncharacterized protein n=1 Tax=Nicotiana tomentosiformis TaxID=4098 RepID=UPI00388CD34B